MVANTLEALGNDASGKCVQDDTNNNCYIDGYFWNFCGAGAADNALYYWNGKTNTYPSGWILSCPEQPRDRRTNTVDHHLLDVERPQPIL